MRRRPPAATIVPVPASDPGDPSASSANRVRVIRPSRGLSLRLGELVEYRELLFFLVWRDVKVRYKQTALGAAWAVLQPLTSMIIFTVIFGRLAKLPSDGVPYALFAYAGLLPWTYFAAGVAQSSVSLVGNANLVTKVYVPRILLPLSAIVVPLVDLAVAFVLLGVLMAGYGVAPGMEVLALPLFLLFAIVTVAALGLAFAAMNVRYRDVPYALPFLIQTLLYVSPVVYPVSFVPERWQWLYSLNPMAGVIDGFRWSLPGTAPPRMSTVGVSAVVAVCGAVASFVYFRRVERHFADRI